MITLAQNYLEEMIAHSQAEWPNEVCGILAGKDGQPLKLYRTSNAEASPVKYQIDPLELLQILTELQEKGWEVFGIYHSHTHSPAYPSSTDIRLALYPEAYYFIVSLSDRKHPKVRVFRIIKDLDDPSGLLSEHGEVLELQLKVS